MIFCPLTHFLQIARRAHQTPCAPPHKGISNAHQATSTTRRRHIKRTSSPTLKKKLGKHIKRHSLRAAGNRVPFARTQSFSSSPELTCQLGQLPVRPCIAWMPFGIWLAYQMGLPRSKKETQYPTPHRLLAGAWARFNQGQHPTYGFAELGGV